VRVPVVESAAGTPTTIHWEVSAELGGSAATGAANGRIRIAHPSTILAKVFVAEVFVTNVLDANFSSTGTTTMLTGADRRTGEAQPELSKL
jgi:hypothetical protein